VTGDPELAKVLARLSERAHHEIDLPYLVNGWQRFVERVQTGYDWTIYDYTNDLGKRNLLAEVIAAVSPASAHALEDLIREADAAYRAATREVEQPILPQPARTHRWWWFRIPRVPTDEMRDDFKHLRLIGD